jgi:spore germination cell wall hydrolase CwlJ-like protein
MNSKVKQKQGEIQKTEEEILAYEEEERRINSDLELLRKQYAEELAKSQAAAKGVWRDISAITFDEGDRYLLANIIYCEAGGEPYAGQVAVGAVVINRVRSSEFPGTVAGVIYQNRQFSPVASGRYALALAENRATQSCYRAADEAMSGMTNVGNCVFFRTPIEGLTGISIGGHIFY